MCGLVGIAGDVSRAKEIISFLLIIDSTRGIDGTGLFVSDLNEEEELIKSVGDCYNLIANKKYSAINSDFKLYLGHNRASTKGKNSTSNSHPFDVGDIVGAHNGTLQGFYANKNGFDVDSEYLLDRIDTLGAKEAIAQEEGAWALTWYNRNEKTLNFLRNKERPLYYGFDEEKNLFWASERWMLEAVKDKFSLKIGKIFLLNEDTQYVYSFNSKGRPVIKEIINNVKAKEPVTAYSAWQGSTSYYSNQNTAPVTPVTPKVVVDNSKKNRGLLCSDCGEYKAVSEIAYRFDSYDRVSNRKVTNYICKECQDFYNKNYNYRGALS